MSAQDQLLAVATWLRGRYETAPAVELPMLASVIAYLETLAALEEQGQTEQGQPEVAEAVAPAPPTMPAEGERPRRQTGTFSETAWGGLVTTDGGTTVRIPYSVVAASGMEHGDRVQLTPRSDGTDHFFFTRSGGKAPVAPSGVSEVVAAIQRGPRGFCAEIDGRRVNVRPATPHLPDFASGDIVSLRYSAEELEKPAGCAYVVRVHAQDPDTQRPKGQTLRRRVRRSARPVPLEPAPPVEPPAPPATPGSLPRVLVVGGHAQNHLHFRRALETVAAVDWCPGSRLTRSLRARVATAPAIVLVTQHMSHNVSEYVMRALRSTNRPYIFARSANHTGLTRQVVEELLPQLQGDGEPGATGPQ